MGIAVFPSGMKGGSLGKSREELIYRVSAFMIEELKLNRFKAVVQVKQTRTRNMQRTYHQHMTESQRHTWPSCSLWRHLPCRMYRSQSLQMQHPRSRDSTPHCCTQM